METATALPALLHSAIPPATATENKCLISVWYGRGAAIPLGSTIFLLFDHPAGSRAGAMFASRIRLISVSGMVDVLASRFRLI